MNNSSINNGHNKIEGTKTSVYIKKTETNYLYEIILSKNFGSLKNITSFNKKLKSLNHIDKITEALNHRKDIANSIKDYRKIEKLIFKHINSEKNSILEKPIFDPNDPLTDYTYEVIMDVFLTKCINVLYHDQHEIIKIIGDSVIFLSNKYSLINEEIEIDLNNEKLSMILPLLMNFEKWKTSIQNSLSNKGAVNDKVLKKNKVLGLLVELDEKLEGETYKLFTLITNFNDFIEYPKDKTFGTRTTVISSGSGLIENCDKIQINEYISFVKQLDLNNLNQNTKLKINNNYKQSELLEILNNFKEDCSFVELSTYDFVYYYTTCDKRSNLDLKHKNNRINNIHLFSKEHRADLLSLIKYLNTKNILESADKRTYAPIIQKFYSKKELNSTTTIYNAYNKSNLPTHSISFLNRMIDQL